MSQNQENSFIIAEIPDLKKVDNFSREIKVEFLDKNEDFDRAPLKSNFKSQDFETLVFLATKKNRLFLASSVPLWELQQMWSKPA